MRILIVEDEVMIREGLAKLIKFHTGHTVIGEASNGQEGLNLAVRFKPEPVSYTHLFDDYPELLRSTFQAGNFYLTPEGIVIYYQQYDIAPYSSGITEFLLPFSGTDS